MNTRIAYWLLGSLLVLSSGNVLAQVPDKISFSFQDQTLKSAVSVLEKEYDLIFAYNERLLAEKRITTVTTTNTKLESALKKLFHPFQLDFELISGQYVLLKPKRFASKKNQSKSPEKIPSICGYVIDDLTDQPLAFANVFVGGTNKGVYTDDKGYFVLQGPFKTTDSLVMSYIGYIRKRLPIRDLVNKPCIRERLKIPESTMVDILIEDQAIALLRSSESGTGMKFQPDEMGMLPGWGDNDILRMAQLLPGIQSSNESASDLHIRGGAADQNLVLWDGIPVYHTGHFFGIFSAFNPYAVNEMSVFRSGFGARYGGRVSGMIEIDAKPGNLDSLQAAIGGNLISLYAYINIPLVENKSALLLAVRRSFTDIIQTRTFTNLFNQLAGEGKIADNLREAEEQNIDILLEPKLYFTDFNAKYVVKASENSTGSISFYAGDDFLDYQVLFEDDNLFFNTTDKVELGNWGLSATWEKNWTPQWSSNWKLVLTQFENSYGFEASLDTMERSPFLINQTNGLGELTLKFDNSWRFTPAHSLHFGYQFTGLRADYKFHFAEADSVDFRDIEESLEGQFHHFYGDFDFNLPNKLGIDFGLRLTNINETELLFWEPRLSIDWFPFGKSLHFKVAVGKYFQFVSQIVEENDLGLGEEIWILSQEDRGFPVLEATQVSGGFWWKNKGWLIDVEAYRKRLNNLSSLNLRSNLGTPTGFDAGQADIYGIDVLIKKKWKHYNTWLSYSLGEIQYDFNNLNDGLSFPASHDQLHSLKWTNLWDYNRWEFSFSWNYGSGRPFTDVEEISLLPDPETEELEYQLQFEPINNSRLPAYHRLDLSGHYKFRFMDRVQCKVGLSIFNVYNRRNLQGKEFFILESNQPGVEPELLQIDRELLGRTPNLFLILEW